MKARERNPRDERTRNERTDERTRPSDVPVRSTGRPKSASTPGQRMGLGRGREQNWPFDLRLSDEMSRFLGSFGLGREFVSDRWLPQVDVLRRGNEVVVRADLPGLKKEDISIDVADNVLTIHGERREESREEREGYYWHERRAGSFYRSIPLPEGADAEHARASFSDGVLEVSVPAPGEESSRGRRIQIK